MQQKHLLVAAIALLLCSTAPVDGQFQNVLSALFGGSATPAATPAATSTATPAATPAATTAAATATPAATTAAAVEATPAATTAAATATPAATTAAATATPAATTAATTATPAATTAAATARTATATPAATTAADDATAAAPAATTAKATPAATVKATPAPTKKAVASPPPPIPVVIDPSKLVPALPADQTTPAPSSAPPASGSGANSTQTAVDVVIQVSGSGVTPFVVPQQTIMLRAMASVLTTVSLGDLSIRYVTSAVNQRRRLLADDMLPQVRRSLLANDSAEAAAAAAGQLYNQASVTLQANCSSSQAVPATLTEIQSVLSNNLLASAVQAYGAPTWGVQLLSLTSVDPNVALGVGPKCKKALGGLCLDGTSLSVAAAEIIIALGAVVVVMILAIPCVCLEWRRKSGQMAELDPTPETPRTPLEKVQQFYNNLVEKAKAASPLHRRGSSNGRNAFRADTPTSATPTSAKEGNRTIQLTATAQP